MKTVINTKLISNEAPQLMSELMKKNPDLSAHIEYDEDSGIVLVDSREKKLTRYILGNIGWTFHDSIVVCQNDEDEKIVRDVYNHLSESDRTHVQIVTADIGNRVSVCIDPLRDDLCEVFWTALYPSDKKASARMRGGRTRDYWQRFTVRLDSKDKEAVAVRLGDWTHMVFLDDGLHVSDDLSRRIDEELNKTRRDTMKRNALYYSAANSRAPWNQRGGRGSR